MTKTKLWKVLIAAIVAGMFIALAGYESTVVSYTIKIPSIAKLLSGIVFPIGLILVVLLKTELFTGNNLLIIPLVDKKIKVKDMLLNWGIVYLGNLIGSILVAVLIYYAGTITSNDALTKAFVGIANNKTNLEFFSAFILGVLCNFLVCSAVFLSATAKDNLTKIFCIFPPIMLLVVLGFEHSVANMFYLSEGFLLSKMNILNILGNNLLPVTLSNIVGGIGLGLILYFTRKSK